ncbi:uncharacterized protein LOC108606606 isoform X2 [Drosophila busckii]|uniref:uncharacterized protein LOC108606606 isoform X2 n=1 Tax=Drosophila busckii TaxID=30019 RepID=UPI00083EECF3|nr:uncharacterized protein LOC108606606 isoform X2 [Drosophila busckii]
MEPHGGLPPDRDRQLVLRQQTVAAADAQQKQQQQQQQLATQLKPTTLSLQKLEVSSGNNNAEHSGCSPALAATATAISATTQAATAFSGSSVGHHHAQHHMHHGHPQHPQHPHPQHLMAGHPRHQHHGSISSASGLLATNPQQTIEKLSRPMAFDKMEMLVREMQDQEHGVPVRQQKMFLTSIPYAFMGYDLIEWLMDRLTVEESEALNIANQLCLHGYFFPVNDSKTLTVKDDSSLYRFQTPYYWPWQHKAPDNVEYAIYLAKRSLRNKQRHALEDYEAEALASLHKNLKGKWDFISMQAEEQVRLAKERKKGDKIVGDSQERAYWRVHRPPPGQFTPLEPCPVPSRDRQGSKPNKKKTVDDIQREVDYLSKSLNRTRMKMSQACESLVLYSETFSEYDTFLHAALPSNPWVTEDIAFWQQNSNYVDVPTEKRVKRWAISIEELVSDPTGLQEFTNFLEKEYSHENIRFWIAVNRLRRSAHSQVPCKVNEIFEEFLKPGAPCEINIDGKTMESVLRGLKHPSRFTFDSASEHIYMLLLKKDCYPRFVRSEHFKRLIDSGVQPSHKKRFFNFGGVSGAKKKMTAALSSQPNLGDMVKGGGGGGVGGGSIMQPPPPAPGSLARRRGSDRSLTGSAHELAVIGVNKDAGSKVPHSHSQSNLSEIPYSDAIYRGDMPQGHLDTGIYAAYGKRDRSIHTIPETPNTKFVHLETTAESMPVANASAVCPWDEPATPPAQVKLSICPWEQESDPPAAPAPAPAPAPATAAAPAVPRTEVTPKLSKSGAQPLRLSSTSSDTCDVAERMHRNLGIRHQNTVDSGEAAGMKRLMPITTEQRRASVSFTSSGGGGGSSGTDYAFGRGNFPSASTSPVIQSSFPPLQAREACITRTESSSSASNIFKETPPPPKIKAQGNAELEEQTKRSSMSLATELAATPTPMPMPAIKQIPAPPVTKITPPPKDAARSPGGVLASQRTPTFATVTELCMESPLTPSNMVKPMIELEPDSEPEVKEVQIELIETQNFGGDVEAQPAELKTAASSVEQPAKDHDDDDDDDDDGDIKVEVELMVQESGEGELSPTTDEYQEGMHFGDDDLADTDSQLGYIPPAPTPAPSMAPLAVLDMDTVDDELYEEGAAAASEAAATAALRTPTASAGSEETRRRRKKRNSDVKKHSSLDEKDKEKASGSAGAAGAAGGDAVCPWEDDNVSTSDGTFVKTYATLGYL